MRKELEEQLVKEHPEMFKNVGGSPKRTCMAWGFEHSDGWFGIIKSLADTLDGAKKSNPNFPIPQIIADQIKEKFGMGRFYCDGLPKELVNEVEDKISKL